MRKPKTSKGFQLGDTKIICPACDGGKVNPKNKKEDCKECKGTGYLQGVLKPAGKFTQRGRR